MRSVKYLEQGYLKFTIYTEQRVKTFTFLQTGLDITDVDCEVYCIMCNHFAA